MKSLFGWLSGDLSGTIGLIGDVLAHVGSSSSISEAVQIHYSHVLPVAPVVAIVAFPLALLVEMRSGSLWRLALYLVLGVTIAVVAPVFAKIVLQAVDAIGQIAMPDMAQQITAIGHSVNAGPLSPTSAVVGIACLIAGVIISFELVIRSVMAVLLVCLAPLVASAMCWRPAREAFRHLVEIFTAIALSKLVIELTMSVGVTLLNQQRGVSMTLIAGATLCLAAFMPFVVLRVIPLGHAGVMHQLDGLRQRLIHSVARSPQHPIAELAMNALPVQPPGVPPIPDDLGLEMWPSEPERPLPDREGPPPRPPVQPVRFPRRPVIRHTDTGPRIEWEWDDE